MPYRKRILLMSEALFNIISFHEKISKMGPADLKYDAIGSYSWTLSTLEPHIYKFSPCVNKKLRILALIITVYYLLPTCSPEISVL